MINAPVLYFYFNPVDQTFSLHAENIPYLILHMLRRPIQFNAFFENNTILKAIRRSRKVRKSEVKQGMVGPSLVQNRSPRGGNASGCHGNTQQGHTNFCPRGSACSGDC